MICESSIKGVCLYFLYLCFSCVGISSFLAGLVIVICVFFFCLHQLYHNGSLLFCVSSPKSVFIILQPDGINMTGEWSEYQRYGRLAKIATTYHRPTIPSLHRQSHTFHITEIKRTVCCYNVFHLYIKKRDWREAAAFLASFNLFVLLSHYFLLLAP